MYTEKKRVSASEALHTVISGIAHKRMAQQLISFAELTGGTETVRCTTIDGKTYMSIRDIIMLVYSKNNDTAGRVWRDFEDTFKEELLEYLESFQFPGQGQKSQPVITLKGALKLMQCLPGKMAKVFRSKAADILVQYFDNNAEKFISWTVDIAKQAQEEHEPETKYVYGAVSEAFPGLVKIGYASSLDSRMIQANVLRAPPHFKIVAHVPSWNASRDERMAHAFFADQKEEGEFFRVGAEAVQNFFTTCILPMHNHEKNVHSGYACFVRFDSLFIGRRK